MNSAAYLGVCIGTAHHVSRITIEGRAQPLLRWESLRHHASHYAWGGNTPGAAQLALAVLIDATDDLEASLEHYQIFKSTVIARLSRSWVLDRDDVIEWVLNQKIDIHTWNRLEKRLIGGVA